MKSRVKYICTSCGYESLRWIGKCPECEEWNSFTEEIIEENKRKPKAFKGKVKLSKISEVPVLEESRIKTGVEEFDRVLGGGLVRGSVTLLGGDPGIGKSTLAMQVASKLNDKILYVTGEESAAQIKMRASRLNINSDNFYILVETDLAIILSAINNLTPSVVIIDSIQTMYRNELENSPGTITQVRECTSLLMDDAKRNNFSVIIIGHVTKEGMIAGPKILEHIVDTVIQFEGDPHHFFRILRAQKNRFGSANEIGIFRMNETGLKEVKNPSELFLSERHTMASGSVIASSVEGTRPILLEVQALVTPSSFGYPQRVATGFDQKRLSILLAVLEKRGNYRLSANNVFLNMAGGVKINEPAVDLAVCCSIVSSLLDKIISSKTLIIGEVGLGGEVRSVSHIEKRIKEAEKLEFMQAVIPANNMKNLTNKFGVKLLPADNLINAIENILSNSELKGA